MGKYKRPSIRKKESLIFESEKEQNLEKNFLEDFLRPSQKILFLTKFLRFSLQSSKKTPEYRLFNLNLSLFQKIFVCKNNGKSHILCGLKGFSVRHYLEAF